MVVADRGADQFRRDRPELHRARGEPLRQLPRRGVMQWTARDRVDAPRHHPALHHLEEDVALGGATVAFPRLVVVVAGHDYYKTRKGYGGTAKGDILFEVMESRVMPRCVDAIARGPLHYTATWKLAQGLTTRPVKFGTITPE